MPTERARALLALVLLVPPSAEASLPPAPIGDRAANFRPALRVGGVGPVEMRLISGLPALQALLPSSSAASRDPLWPLDSAGSLRQWLSDQSVRWCEQDGSFAAHRAIALLELEAGAEYKALTERHRAARAAYKSAEGRLRVEEAEHAVQGGEKAAAGLRAYANAGSDADSAEVRLWLGLGLG